MIKKTKNKIFIIFALFQLFIINKAFSNDTFELLADKLIYKDNKQVIIAEGNAFAKDNYNKKIYADKIIYYKKTNIIKTIQNSKFEDGKNKITANNFVYNINNKVIEAIKKVIFTDNDGNQFYFTYLKYNENNQKGFGKKLKTNLKDKSYTQSDDVEIDFNKNITRLKNAKYTTCEILNNKKGNFCPSWSLNSKNVIHDKEKKKLIHKNSVLKIKNFPIFYSPYLSHPDPSVKRQSGFLPPAIKSLSNIGRTLSVPYFLAISDDKDLTITPVYYTDEYSLLKTSYRQDFKNSFLQVENGYSKGYKDLNKTGRTPGSRSYLFADFKGKYKNIFFKENELTFKLQRVSQENFLRVNKINTKLFSENIRILENSFKISSYGPNKRIEIKTGVFENLDSPNNTKYTHYLPDGIYSQNFNNIKYFSTNLNSYFQGKKFSTNQKQGTIKNIINLNSKNQLVQKNTGLGSRLKLSINNINSYNDNVTGLDENLNIKNYFTIATDSELPLAKFDKNSYTLITPRVFVKYTTGEMKNSSDDEKYLNYSDVFAMNRTNNLDKPETGLSFGYGISYDKTITADSKESPDYKYSLGLAQVMRTTKLEKMPVKSSLNNKNSDFAGFFQFNVDGKKENNLANDNGVGFLDNFKRNYAHIKYDYNLENDFSNISRSVLKIESSYNKFYTGINFQEKKNHVGDLKSGTLNIKKLFHDNYYLNFSGTKNFNTSETENIEFGINFENDCILTSLNLSKNFYSDKDFTSSKSLIFRILIKPFSDNIAPDLTSFIE